MRKVRGYVARGECHQSRSCYVMGCENDICRRISTQWVKRSRHAHLQQQSVQHGPVGYDCGCRCDICTAGRSARYKREALMAVRRLELT